MHDGEEVGREAGTEIVNGAAAVRGSNGD